MGRDLEAEELDALISLCIERCRFVCHRFEGTKFIICVCIAPNGTVLASGFAQRHEGEFILEVGIEYATQQCKSGAIDIMRRAGKEDLLNIVNFTG